MPVPSPACSCPIRHVLRPVRPVRRWGNAPSRSPRCHPCQPASVYGSVPLEYAPTEGSCPSPPTGVRRHAHMAAPISVRTFSPNHPKACLRPPVPGAAPQQARLRRKWCTSAPTAPALIRLRHACLRPDLQSRPSGGTSVATHARHWLRPRSGPAPLLAPPAWSPSTSASLVHARRQPRDPDQSDSALHPRLRQARSWLQLHGVRSFHPIRLAWGQRMLQQSRSSPVPPGVRWGQPSVLLQWGFARLGPYT